MLSKNKIKQILALSGKKGREKHHMFVAEGSKWVEDALNSGFLVSEIFATPVWLATHKQLKDKTTVIESDELKKITQLTNHQQVLALLAIPTPSLHIPDLKNKLILVLDSVRDPGNLGTIIRLADWFGIEHIICSADTVDVYNPKVVQATMGALTHVAVYYTELTHFFAEYKKLNIPVYGTFLEGENVYKQSLLSSGAIIMGNEGKGISTQIETFVSNKLYIPTFSKNNQKSESLNVAMATAVILSEFRRR